MWELCQQIIKNPISGIIWALIAFLVGNRLAIGREKIKDFNCAAAFFREAFLPERRLLDIRHAPEGSENKSALDIIEPAIQRHTEAMLRFVHYLPRWKRIGFTRAWNKYAHYKVKGESDTPYLAMYGQEKWEGKDPKELAIKRIDKLLKYAKRK